MTDPTPESLAKAAKRACDILKAVMDGQIDRGNAEVYDAHIKLFLALDAQDDRQAAIRIAELDFELRAKTFELEITYEQIERLKATSATARAEGREESAGEIDRLKKSQRPWTPEHTASVIAGQVKEIDRLSKRVTEGWTTREAARAEGVRAGIEMAAKWQPIETAPKDGTFVDMWFPGNGTTVQSRRVTNCRWRAQHTSTQCYWFAQAGGLADRIVEYRMDDPTHWMPLPEPPSSAVPDPSPADGRT